MRVVLITVGILLLGFVLCPRTPGKDRVDPEVLVRHAFGVTTPSAKKNIQYLLHFLDNPKRWTPLVEGEEKIAGRDTWIVRLKPYKKRTPWVQCWIDKENYAILASRVWDGHNHLIGSAKTTKITF